MAIDVLGPVRVESASLHPRERAVLAALVVRDGNPIAAEDLAEAVWIDAERPATWNKQIQGAVARLRKALGAERIVTTASGYRLDVDPDEIDAHRFTSLVSRARTHHLSGEAARAVDGYRRALALWHGHAYDDVSGWPEAAAAASDLEQLRTEASEGMLRARVDAGDAIGVVPEAERLVRDEPLRESRWALLALALYRSGRQADALAVLRSARERLADELGVDAGREITDLETAILQHDDVLEDAAPVTRTRADCPYRGLGTYRESDAEDFFGRDDEIAAATRRLDDAGLLVVTGASGSGKSSLVRAGLVPSLRRRGRRILVTGPGTALVDELREATGARGATDVIVVDQFEEVLESGDALAADVAALLAAFVDRGGKAIITVRSDFLDRTAGDPSVGPLMSESVVVVSPMSQHDLRRVIEEPAARAGLTLEPGLVELMLRDAADAPGVLPHLSHALAETWVRREGPVLTVAGYEATGGIGGAIAQSADRLFTGLDAADQELCRSTLLRLVALAPDGLPVRRRITAAPLREDASRARLFDLLAHARLVSVEGDSVALVHESLTRAWPRFRGWVREGAEDLAVLGNVQSGAEAWDAGGRLDDDLARGARLQAMLELRERVDPSLTALEAEFVDASASHEQDEKRALEEAAESERRQNRRLRFAIAGVAVIAVIAVISGGLAVRSSMSEAAIAESATIDALVNRSAALQETNPAVAALLAAEVHRRWPDDPRTAGALFSLLGSPAGSVDNYFIPGTELRVGSAFIPGTNTAFVVRDMRYPEIRDLDTGELIRRIDVELPESEGQTRPFVRVSDDGRTAMAAHSYAIGTNRGPLEDFGYWFAAIDLESDSLITDPVMSERWADTYALSGSGNLAAYVYPLGDLVVIDVATGQIRLGPERIGGGDEDPGFSRGAVGFAADDTLHVGTYDGELLTIDPVSLETVDRTAIPEMAANTEIIVLSDGRVVGSGYHGIFAASSGGEVLWQHEFDEAWDWDCRFITVVEQSEMIYCGNQSTDVVHERDLATGEPTGRRLEYALGPPGELALLDETDLALFSAVSPSIGRWHMDGAIAASDLVAAGEELGQGFDPSGRYFVTLPANAEERADVPYTVWDSETLSPVQTVSAEFVYWIAPGRLRTVALDRTNSYVDVAGGAVTPAPDGENDIDRAPDEFQWSEVFPSRDPGVFYEGACCTGMVRTMDALTGEPLGDEFEVSGPPLSIAESADRGTLIVSAYDDESTSFQIAAFDLATGELLTVRTGRDYPSMAVTADDRIITAGEGSLVISDIGLDRIGVLPGPQDAAGRIMVSDDDRIGMLATDGRFALYDLESDSALGDPVSASPGIVAPSAALHPSGDWILVNTPRGVVRWNLDPAEWADKVCRVAGRNLTVDEWTTYMSGLGEWRETCTFPAE